MMLPLCTSVTLGRFWAIAYSMAARISRLEPSSDTGLMPMALVAGKRMDWAPICPWRNSITRLHFGSAGLVLDAGVDVLRVLAEDHHVHVLRCLHRRGHALEPAHRPHAGVQIELLPQRDVERAEPAADRRGERPLDRHEVALDGGEGLVRQPAVEPVLGLLAGQHLEPRDPPAAAVRPLDRGVEHAPRGAPDVGPGAVTLDERNDRASRGPGAGRPSW